MPNLILVSAGYDSAVGDEKVTLDKVSYNIRIFGYFVEYKISTSLVYFELWPYNNASRDTLPRHEPIDG